MLCFHLGWNGVPPRRWTLWALWSLHGKVLTFRFCWCSPAALASGFDQQDIIVVPLRMKIAVWHDSSASRMTFKTNHQCLILWLKGLAMSAYSYRSSIANSILLKWWVSGGRKIYDSEFFSTGVGVNTDTVPFQSIRLRVWHMTCWLKLSRPWGVWHGTHQNFVHGQI